MPNDDIITDDYVADMLAKEAADHALRYSSMGMDEFCSDKKRPANIPKPDKRFLQRIIKSTNTHNANLLASETAESQARLQDLEKAEERQKRKNGAPEATRRRQMGDIKAILGGRSSGTKAGSSAAAEGPSRSRGHRDGRSESPQRNTPRKRRGRDRDEDPESADREASRKQKGRSRSPGQREERRNRRSRSPPAEDANLIPKSRRSKWVRSGDGRLGGNSTPRHHGSSYKRDPDPDKEEDLITSKSHRKSRKENGKREDDRDLTSRNRDTQCRYRSRSRSRSSTSESDPIDDVIGPAPPPPVRRRGRGFQQNISSTTIDRRFEADYDPKTDMEMEEITAAADNNWDVAVESFRDRKKWQQNQEQRMREAGFGDAEITRWRKSGQRSEEDVRWSKAGEKREWDRGKEGELKGIFSHDD